MRELERKIPPPHDDPIREYKLDELRLAVIGRGRAGGSIALAAERAGLEPRTADRDQLDETLAEADAALLCVPDTAIETCAAGLAGCSSLQLVGHVSGAVPLSGLDAARDMGAEAFGLHPLQTLPDQASELTGAACAVSGSSPAALAYASSLALRLGMKPFELEDAGRTAYHAAAAIASNFLVALEESAVELMAAAGVAEPRELLAPLVLRSAANWSEAGAAALTGPIARGDEATVARHTEAIAARAPHLLPLYETLADRTRALLESDPPAKEDE